jgi:DNA-binding protein H-NS
MPSISTKDMDLDALLTLRADLDHMLTERSRDLQRQLALLDGHKDLEGGEGRGRRRISAMKGVKVPPKYRGPEGETWAGRGATPKWLTTLIKQGHSIEDFAIARKGGRAANPGAKKKGIRARKG